MFYRRIVKRLTAEGSQRYSLGFPSWRSLMRRVRGLRRRKIKESKKEQPLKVKTKALPDAWSWSYFSCCAVCIMYVASPQGDAAGRSPLFKLTLPWDDNIMTPWSVVLLYMSGISGVFITQKVRKQCVLMWFTWLLSHKSPSTILELLWAGVIMLLYKVRINYICKTLLLKFYIHKVVFT